MTEKTKKTRKQLKAEKKELKAQIAALTKELEAQKGYAKMYRESDTASQKTINEMHEMLDGVYGVLPKAKDTYGENSLQTRFVSLFSKLAGLHGYKETSERTVSD